MHKVDNFLRADEFPGVIMMPGFFAKTYMESGKPKTDSAYGRAMRMAFSRVQTSVCTKSIILSI